MLKSSRGHREEIILLCKVFHTEIEKKRSASVLISLTIEQLSPKSLPIQNSVILKLFHIANFYKIESILNTDNSRNIDKSFIGSQCGPFCFILLHSTWFCPVV